MANVTLTAEKHEDPKKGLVARRSRGGMKSTPETGRLIAFYKGERFGYVTTPVRGTPVDQKVLTGFFDDGTVAGEWPNQAKARTGMEHAYCNVNGLQVPTRGRPKGSTKAVAVAEVSDEIDETGAEFGGEIVIVPTGESAIIVAE